MSPFPQIATVEGKRTNKRTITSKRQPPPTGAANPARPALPGQHASGSGLIVA
jgi:hypothetical protein